MVLLFAFFCKQGEAMQLYVIAVMQENVTILDIWPKDGQEDLLQQFLFSLNK